MEQLKEYVRIVSKDLNYDPVTAEVVQMRLKNIVDEMARTLMRTSGSPILTEAQDFCTAIFDEKYEHVAFSGYVITHIGSSLEGVKSIRNYYPQDLIKPGDHFILNDPHTAGALHQGDVAIISPLFYQNEFIGWAFSNAHISDIGGMSPGGWAPIARDLYSEALRFAPTKIVSEGKYSYEIFNLIRNNVRLPEPVVNDIKSLIAANIVSQRRIIELIDTIGLEWYRFYCEINKSLSEKMVRSRIEKIPDGVFETEDWVEYDGHGEDRLVKIGCKLTINESNLKFDFSNTDPQLDAFINAGSGPMIGIVGAMLMHGLGYDIPMNAGILRPVEIGLGKPGTVVNPTIPAPVSCGHMEGAPKAGRALWEALVQALQLSEDPLVRGRVAALSVYSWPGNSWVGVDQNGQYTAFAVLDCGSGGLGAQSTGDGLDISCYEVMLNNSIPDIEINEGLYPMLYLWRSINQDSGGAGYNRGGQGIDLAWIPYGTLKLTGTLENSCAEIPSRGVLGGYPGSTNSYKIYRDVDVHEYIKRNGQVPVVTDIASDCTLLPNHAAYVDLGYVDVFHQQTGGGGGYGDPIFRPISKVEEDLIKNYITPEMAEKAYGVILNRDGEVDKKKTIQRRSEILSERISKNVTYHDKTEQTFGLELRARDGQHEVACAACTTSLSKATDEWRDHVISKEFELAGRLEELSTEIKARKDSILTLKESYCPHCGVMLETLIKKTNTN